MKNAWGETPEDVARMIVLSWARQAHAGSTGDMDRVQETNTPAFALAVQAQLAKVHDHLASEFGLDTTSLWWDPAR